MSKHGNTFRFFISRYPRNTILVVCLLVLAGAAEALGIMAFLPFIQIFLEGKQTIESVPFKPLNNYMQAHNITFGFIHIGIFIISAIIAKAFILWLAMLHVGKVVAEIAADFRNRYLKALIAVNWRFLTTHNLGKSLNSISTEAFRASQTFISGTRFLAACIQAIIYIGSAFILSWPVCLGILIVGLIVASILHLFVSLSRAAGEAQTKTYKNMLAKMGDIIQGLKMLRAMAIEQTFLRTLYGYSSILQKAQFDQMRARLALRTLHEPLIVISAVAGIYIAMNIGALTGTEMAVMMIFFVRIMTSLNNAQSELQGLAKEESALHSIREAIAETESVSEDQGGLETPPNNILKIQLKDVTFLHEDNVILKNACMAFENGTLTLLEGETGAGKSTIFDLICRFYTPNEGTIYVNDKPLTSMDLKKWRQKIGFVPQEVFLFNDNIFNNIVAGREGISEEDVWRALEEAGAKDFVEVLPEGLNAQAGEAGRKFSGGQRQRLSIARAIAGNPSILLLDEPTSALDPETESKLMETLQKIAKNKIVIMASHNRILRDQVDHCIIIEKQK